MDQLEEKIKTLKEIAINLTDVTNNYSKVAYIIKEIQKNQRKVLEEIKLTNNIDQLDRYEAWVNENEQYLLWLIELCLDIDNLIKDNQTLSLDNQKNLENLIQFLTKYQAIHSKISNEETSEKIKNQINELYQEIFSTSKKLIASHNNFEDIPSTLVEESSIPIINDIPETKDISPKENIKAIIKKEDKPRDIITFEMIEPYFNYSSKEEVIKPVINEEPKIIEPEIKITDPIPFKRENKALKRSANYLENTFHLKDEFKVSLNSRLYPTQTVDILNENPPSCCLYPPNINRSIVALGIKVDDKIYKAALKSEVEKLLAQDGDVVSVLSLCLDHEEGWYPISDIKKVD